METDKNKSLFLPHLKDECEQCSDHGKFNNCETCDKDNCLTCRTGYAIKSGYPLTRIEYCDCPDKKYDGNALKKKQFFNFIYIKYKTKNLQKNKKPADHVVRSSVTQIVMNVIQMSARLALMATILIQIQVIILFLLHF